MRVRPRSARACQRSQLRTPPPRRRTTRSLPSCRAIRRRRRPARRSASKRAVAFWCSLTCLARRTKAHGWWAGEREWAGAHSRRPSRSAVERARRLGYNKERNVRSSSWRCLMTRSLQWRGTVVLAALLMHQSLAAQAAKVRRGASLDLAALMNGEIRASVAPLVAGRAALGVSLARWWGGQTTYYPVPLSTQIVEPAPTFDALHPGREYMVDLYARVYPVSLSSATPQRRISGYLGGFVGFHRREFDQTIQYACTGVDPVICPLMGAPSG